MRAEKPYRILVADDQGDVLEALAMSLLYLTIQNRKDGPGCEVNIKLPMCVLENVNQLESAW